MRGGGGGARGSRARDGAVDPHVVADALLAATRGSREAVHTAYHQLLATLVQRAHQDRRLVQEQTLQTPALRLRLLRSALRVLQRWDESILAGASDRGSEGGGGGRGGAGAGEGSGSGLGGGFESYGASGAQQHVRAALGDVCVGYAGEARRLLQVPTSAQGAAEALAADFDALGKRLIG